MQVAIGVRQFDVHAGFDRERARLLLVLCHEVAVRVGTVAQLPNCEVVGYDKSFEPPLFAKHVT